MASEIQPTVGSRLALGSAAQLPMLAWQAERLQIWRLLVRHKEYMVDRLQDELEALRQEKAKMAADFEKQERERERGEIFLCVFMFAAGLLLGWALL
ncbi:MAG: hypothetical protein LUP97_09325 [Methanoregula sp.]|jgi:hypothetical protein|nr:hypothetical protein [Methanoregula sp.]